MRSRRTAAIVAIVAAALVILVPNPVVQSVMVLVLIYAVIGLGWNVIGGIAGQTSFGHAMFVGIGAYTVAILQTQFGISPLVGVIPAMALAVVAALLIGWPTFRLSGVYFSLATLAFPLMMLPLVAWLGLQEVSVPYRVTDGPLFLQFSDPRLLTACALALLVAAAIVSRVILTSRFGAALIAIREEPVAAATVGIDIHRRKLQAYCISAAITAAAGALYASVLLVITPDAVFGLIVSVQALIIPLVGGRGTVWGPILGSAILITISQVLNLNFGAIVPGINGLLFGVALVLAVAFARDGIAWRVRDQLAARRAARQPVGAVIPIDRVRIAPPVEVRPKAPVDRGGDPVLVVRDLRKSFKANEVLGGVTFSVHAGEIVGIIGPNGAGKTTLVNILNGMVSSSGGSVLLRGRPVLGKPTHRLSALGIARTFQVPRVLPRLTAFENVRIATLAHEDDEARAMNALDLVGLRSRSDELASALDVGELRRLELARALAGDPSVILIDEILAGLSSLQVEGIVSILKRVAGMGVAIVIIEHTMGAMLELADRLIMLDAGRFVVDGAPEVVVSDRRVIDAYLGRKWAANA